MCNVRIQRNSSVPYLVIECVLIGKLIERFVLMYLFSLAIGNELNIVHLQVILYKKNISCFWLRRCSVEKTPLTNIYDMFVWNSLFFQQTQSFIIK